VLLPSVGIHEAVRPSLCWQIPPYYPNIDWLSTWRSLFFLPLDRRVIDLNWKIAHGVLYTAERLISFGYAYNPSCFCGFQTETLEHPFFSCPLAQSVIAWIQSVLFQASSLAPTIEACHLLFGFSTDEFQCVPRVFAYVLNVCKYFIWVQRNDFRFRAKPPGALGLLACIKCGVRFYLPLFYKRFISARRHRFFGRQWGANGAVGSVSNGVFTFAL